MRVKTIAAELRDANVRFISLVAKGANRIPFRIVKSEKDSDMLDLTTLRPVLKGEKIPAPTKKAANLPGFAQILGASVSRNIGDAPPKATIAPAKPVQPVQSIAGTNSEKHAPASGGKPTRQAFNTPKQPASTLPAASRDNPVTYASLQAAIDAAMSKQRDEEKARAFNQSRSAFSRIHKSTAPDARSGTGNAHALRNLGGRMAAAILGGTARKDEGHSLPTNTGFRAVSGASLKGKPAILQLIAATPASPHLHHCSGMFSPMEQAPATAKPPTGLSAKQVQAVYALAAGASRKATAKALGMEPHTLTRWGQLPAFRALLGQVTASIEADSLYAVKVQRLKALDTLSDLMDEQHPAQVRLSAARAALELPAPALTPVEEANALFEGVMKHFKKQEEAHGIGPKH